MSPCAARLGGGVPRSVLAALGALLCAFPPAPARAAETEQRVFSIHVGGKPAGDYRLTITRQDNGEEVVTAQAGVRVKAVLKTYTYTYQGTERWKDGRLLELRSSTSDDGKRFDVLATAEGNNLRVRVSGQTDRLTRWDVWPTSHWHLPDARFHNQGVPLLDADTGKEFTGQLQYLGIEAVTVGGQAQKCYHFRVLGAPASPVDLWYDGAHRVVRQEFTVEGHRTVFQLTALRRQ